MARLLIAALMLLPLAEAPALAAPGASAKPTRMRAGVTTFLRAKSPTRVMRHYAFGRFRVPGLIAKGMKAVGLRGLVRDRHVMQVTNATLDAYTRATDHGYLEVVVPANRGHVYFRHAGKVFDFSDKGLRVGAVRPIKSDRYGLLVKLTPAQEARLTTYLDHMERSGGKELGNYDFHGKDGFHCVTWFMRATLGDHAGDNLVALLGGKPKDGASMPRFSRFMLKKAKGIQTVAVYKADPSPRPSSTA
ncbi:MAG: hypothetical protein KAI47_25940 [Deltaproteobacteria bacterium]|nr:hypothetical protein [Deltaproteobacteria bacterium]